MKNWVCTWINCRVLIYQCEPEGDKSCPGCGRIGGKQQRPVTP